MRSRTPHNRSAALAPYHILDTLPEQAYDDITRLASQICGTSIALLNFLTDEYQWTKSAVGAGTGLAALEASFCVHTTHEPQHVLIVSDTLYDDRFATNPYVTGAPYIRFYAGAPLSTPEGTVIGTVCVIDQQPHTLDDAQTYALQALARQVVAQLELRRTAAALQRSETRFQLFMDNSPVVAFLKDAAGCYQYVNQPLLEQFNLTADAIIGHATPAIWPSETATHFHAQDRQVLESGTTQVIEEAIPTLEGHNRIWQVYKFPVPDADEYWIGGIGVDITAQKQYAHYLEVLQQQLEGTIEDLTQTSQTDPLTGVANRRAFDSELAAAVAATQQTQQPLALIMIDVDHFKHYNDTYGHLVGDLVLGKLAFILQTIARSTDMIARYGGEEFVLLLPNTTVEQAQVVAERCRLAIEAAQWPGRHVTISVGVAVSSGSAIDPVALLDAADAALYQAKHQGRNCIFIAQ